MTDPRDPVKVLLEACSKDDEAHGWDSPMARALTIMVEVVAGHAHTIGAPCRWCNVLAQAAAEVTHE